MTTNAGQDLRELVAKAMQRAFHLGQTYWQQADSESYTQNHKSDQTMADFRKLTEEIAALTAAQGDGSSTSPQGDACPACNGAGGERWYEFDGSENGAKCPKCDGSGHAQPAPVTDGEGA